MGLLVRLASLLSKSDRGERGGKVHEEIALILRLIHRTFVLNTLTIEHRELGIADQN